MDVLTPLPRMAPRAEPVWEPMDNEGGDAMAWWQACQAAPGVSRKPQLFLWMQSHLRRFLPHELVVCAATRPAHPGLAVHVFHGVPLPQPALGALADPGGPLLRMLVGQWLKHPGQAAVVNLHAGDAGTEPARAQLIEQGFADLLVHAVPSARELDAVDSLFVLGSRTRCYLAADARALAVMLPLLHLMTLRVSAGEDTRSPARARASALAPHASALTQRERQILLQVREGKRNAEIGQALGISALTVKNHLQNILRKLGASNRAQAVAEAISKNLLGVAGR